MAQDKMVVVVMPRWWLKPWLRTLVFVAVTSGRGPDWAKVQRVIARGLRIKVKVPRATAR